MTETLTVITPCFNVGEYLTDCIASVQQSRTFGEFEVQHIIVDDGSKDQTQEVLKKIEMPNLTKIFLPENGGQAEARNVGLRAATSKYVFFLDGDDVLFENSLRYLFEQAEKFQANWVYGDFLRVDDQKRYLLGQDYYGWRYDSAAELLTAMYTGRHFFQQNNLYSRKLLHERGGFDSQLRMAEDFDLCTRILLTGEKPTYLPGPLYLHRYHDHNLSLKHLGNPVKHHQDIKAMYLQYRAKIQAMLTAAQLQEVEKFLKNIEVEMLVADLAR